MIPHSWIETQVFSMPLVQIKQVLGRERLRIDRRQIVAYLMGLMAQQGLLRHYKAIHSGKTCEVCADGSSGKPEWRWPLWLGIGSTPDSIATAATQNHLFPGL